MMCYGTQGRFNCQGSYIPGRCIGEECASYAFCITNDTGDNMSNTNDFSGVKVGDKLWSIELGECEVTTFEKNKDDDYPIVCENNDIWEWYTLDGKLLHDNAHQSLFWSRPEIIAPEKPKRMVKKTVEGWANVYPNGTVWIHKTKETADKDRASKRIACVHLTGEYEVEEA